MSDETTKRVAVTVGGKPGSVDEADLAKMPKGSRVSIITPDGKFDTIGAEFADEVKRAGGRVLTQGEAEKAQGAQREGAADLRMQQRYDALPTHEKVAGVVQSVTNALGGGALGTVASGLGIGPTAPPMVDSYQQGVVGGLSAGLAHGAARQVVEATSGKEAAEAYAQRVDDARAANPWSHGIGNAAGTLAGVVTAPGAAAEQLATKAIARTGLQATSALGRAGIAALEVGARGAAEGAAMGAGEYVGDALLRDHEVAADKLFGAMGTGAVGGGLAGFGLGAGGSLAMSGLRAGARAGLSRLVTREATDAVAREGAEVATEASSSPSKVQRLFDDPTAGAKTLANELAFDALGATKKQMSDALSNGLTKDEVGGYVNRVLKSVVGESASAWQVGKAGRADDLLSAIQADKSGRIATGLSDAVKGTPARVDMQSVINRAGQEADNMARDPIRAAGAEPFWNRVSREIEALRLSGKVASDGTLDAADAFYLRSGLAKNAYEVSKVSGHAGEAYKAFLRDFDQSTIRAIDEAGAAAGKSGVGDNIRHWKREWQLASAAESAAEGGAERIAGNNFFGLREGIALATGLATGHAVLPLAGATAFKVAKERGKAVLAYKLAEAAERGTLAKWVAKSDEQIARASKGLITPPQKGAANAPPKVQPMRDLARRGLERVASFQADPDAFVDNAARNVESIGAHSPEIADGIVQRQVRALAFLSSKVPYQGEPDPLDPHPKLRMTPNEQASFAKYAYYTEKPERFFAEVARGKLTPEGAETAQALMPRAFAELQQLTAEALVTQLARGNRLPYRQQLLLGQLLDFAATPSQRPEHAAFLQANVEDNRAPSPIGSRSSRNASSTFATPSALDRLEAVGAGRRR